MQTAKQLTAQAFEQARQSGKQDWKKMTTAVLKNRLLDLTGGTFDEAAYGATAFMDFVVRNTETLLVDRSTVPPLVELRNAPSPQPSDRTVDVSTSYRIRPAHLRSMPDDRNRDIRAHLLGSQHATELYGRMHRRNIGVFEVGRIHVPVIANPRNNLRDYLPLRQFVRYKSFHQRVGSGTDTTGSAEHKADDFQDWIDRAAKCEGENDPRCLPLHVFSTNQTHYDLDPHDGRRRFIKDHGPQGSRCDGKGLQWNRPKARDMHGRQVVHVSGCPLISGFHWDVSIGPRATGPAEVSSTAETWRVWGEGYVNIYPNAEFRVGKNSARIYPSNAKERKQKEAR